jgi:hypothetical protein
MPNTSVAEAGVTATVATGTGMTVIEGVVALGAVSLVAVIVAVPRPTAVTVTAVPLGPPAGVTLATVESLETQLTVRPVKVAPVAFFVVAVSGCVSRSIIGVVGAESVTDVTGASVTVIEDVPVLLSLVAVIVALPAPIAVTRPFPSTVATIASLEVQLTTRPVRVLSPASFVTAVSCRGGVIPRTRLALVGLTVTVATGTGLTVITGVGAELTDSLVAVIVAVPTPTAVTVVVPLVPPAGLTVNTAVLLETQLTVRPINVAPSAFVVVAVSC